MRRARELAQHHSVRAVQRLVKLLGSKNESVVIRAAEVILDRGLGKPVTVIDMMNSGVDIQPEQEKKNTMDFSRLTREELQTLRTLYQKAQRPTEEEPHAQVTH
jgi:phosphotransacetylase